MNRENSYVIKDDYIIGSTPKGFNFYFDFEDKDKVIQYYWKKGSEGLFTINNDGKIVYFQSLVFSNGPFYYKDGNIYNFRKNNLAPLRGYRNDGKTILNGYIAIYFPEHPRAYNSNGCVYEHILVAERMLGRPLKDQEVIHHKDFNRQNNDETNLMVFRSDKDHTSYHAGNAAIKLEDNTFICPSQKEIVYKHLNMTISDPMLIDTLIDPSTKNLCPKCKKNFKSVTARQCKQCWLIECAKNIPAKEELEQLIYDTPFTQIGKKYGVSDNTVKKWCKKYGLPFRKKDMV